MDKLTMANSWALKLLEINDGNLNIDYATSAWSYADAMQAEADKREDKALPDAILNNEKRKQEQINHHDALVEVGLEEWQPDWSQAPDGFNRFVVGSDGGYGFFTNMEPQLQDDFWFVGADGIVIKDHGYQGNWQDSLRKRP